MNDKTKPQKPPADRVNDHGVYDGAQDMQNASAAMAIGGSSTEVIALAIAKHLEGLDTLELVSAINKLRAAIHSQSPFASEPVDFVRWVSADEVTANDYNPNVVAPPEMELLRISIMADGYTQPIVTNRAGNQYVVVDGFHRNRVGRECKDVRERVQGYLPVVQIREAQTDTPERMASTIRHNRARGKHTVDGMSDIVLALKRRNWSDEKIGRELGMDPDEVLRLTQISGLAEMFANKEFSEAWEAGTASDDELQQIVDQQIKDDAA